MATTKIYGWFYDKQGNKRIVDAPINAKGKTVNRKHRKINTGAIPDSVGYPNFGSK